MKRTRYLPWLLGAALLGLLPGPSAAQSVRPPAGADSLRRKLYQVFAPLDASQVPTGYLAEYATPLLPLDTYPGTVLADSTLTDMDVFRQLYLTVLTSRVSGSETLPDLATFNARRQEAEAGGTAIPLAVECLAYARLRPDAVTANLLSVQNEQVFDVPGRAQSPYQQQVLFAAAPSFSYSLSSNVSFVFRRSLYLTNTDQDGAGALSLDFGTGLGYQSARWEKPLSCAYASAGIKRIKVRVVYNTADGPETRESWFDLRVLNGPPVAARYDPKDPTRRVDVTAPFTATYVAGASDPNYLTHKGAKVSVCYAQGHSQLVKPFIVVEGYNTTTVAPHLVGVNNQNNDVEGFLREIDRSTPYAFNDQLDLAHYDIVYIDFTDGAEDIRRNAALFQEVVRWVNTNKVVDPTTGARQPNVVMGESMGGLVARYGLGRMVRAGEAHDTRLLVLHDSPQRGANSPLGVQALTVQSDFPVPIPFVGASIHLSGFNDRLSDALKILQAPATYQLSILNVTDAVGGYAQNTFIDGPYKDIVDFSNSLPNEPKPTYDIIATSDGSQCGRPQNTAPHTELIRNNTDWMYAPITSVGTRLNFHAEATANALPAYGVNDRIAHLRVWTAYRIRIGPITLATIDINLANLSYPAPSNTLPYETLPGGTENPAAQSDAANPPGNVNYFNTYAFATHSTLYNGDICFVPTYSALDVPTVSSATAFPKYINGVTDNPSVPRVARFIAMEASGSTFNQSHLRFTARNSEWIFNEMESITTSPPLNCSPECEPLQYSAITGPSSLCPGAMGQYTISNLPAGYTITWQATGGATPPSGTGTPFSITAPGGSATIQLTATVANACTSRVLTTAVQVGTGSLSLAFDPNQPRPAATEPLPDKEAAPASPTFTCSQGVNLLATDINVPPPYTATVTTYRPTGATTTTYTYYTRAFQLIVHESSMAVTITGTSTCTGARITSNTFRTGGCAPERMMLTATLYPNPARETVDVHLDHPDAAQPVTVRLFDGYGRLRAEQVSRGEATLRLKTDQLPAGLYFVHLLRGNQVLKREQLRIEK